MAKKKTSETPVVAEPEIARCLFTGCVNPRQSRGLCTNHYSCAAGLVKQGLTTWESLESKGKALPVGKKKGAAQSFFLS